MAQEIVSIDGNTFQYFTRNPRGGAIKDEDDKDIEAYKEYASEHGITTIMAYAPYAVDPASGKLDTRDFTEMVLSEDLARAEDIPGQYYLVRPGSAVGLTPEQGIQNVIDCFNKVLSASMSTRLLIDTEAGEGSQVGSNFNEIAQIISGIKESNKVGVCIDCSAVWAAGYDIKSNLDDVLDEFDKQIGLEKLLAIHLNDSKEPLGSKVDRHTRIGEGEIGFDALSAITKNPRTKDSLFILEEYDPTLVVYEHDIARFKAAL